MAKANTHSRMSLGDRIFDSINVVLLGLLALIIIYPLVYVLSASFSDPVSVASGDMILWPVNLTLENYEEVFKNQSIITGYRNSLIILVSGTALNLVMTVLAAFPMSRRDLWGRNVMMKLMTFTMFFSGGLIPTYLLITRTLGLMNSWLALILPGAISVYNMIIMRTYFQTSIPYELQEAADIDGCSPFGVLIRIILPLSGPILAVIGLYYGVGHWNSYFSALLYDTIPTTTDELLEYFRATAAYDYNENSQADEIALSAGSIDDVMYLFMGSYGLMNRGSSHRDVYVDDDGELQYAYSSERFKEELRCLNRLYTEGLLDPDIFTIDFAQLIAKSSTEDATEMASIKTEQENYMKEWRAYFITGQRDIDADWDEYVAGYDGMNTARYMELYRAAREAMGVE